jgi:hypothetical protein
MATVTMTFDLDTELLELQDAIDGSKWKSVVWSIDQELRKRIKYSDEPETNKQVYEKLRDDIRNFIDDYQLNLD